MARTDKAPATLLDELVVLDQARRCEVADELRKVAETLVGVPDGRTASHVLSVLDSAGPGDL
ncbi:hypothetical protein [Mycobacterium sp.]|uniref:hypothetical protein n=1 Tax=Mycobacterium sp. TaxID=1785 RepID=UPI003F96DF64